MNIKEHIVNLDLPAEHRWDFLSDYHDEIDDLLECYLNDFEGAELIFESIDMYKELVIPQDYIKEASSIAAISKFSENEVFIANLYYDVLKFYFGCTAFAVTNESTVLHARNLDWHTENNLLSEHTRIFNYQRGGRTIFKTVGWVGFIGALSGIKPGSFSVTLNAVLSNDSPEIAYPISFLLRDVLDVCSNYEQALQKLQETTIASDCLLLLSGISSNEKAVIERTPKRQATRFSTGSTIVVTNDYKELDNNETSESILQSTSCGRFDRASELINNNGIMNSSDCIKVLQDQNVMMGITVQQMCFNNTTGEIVVLKNAGNTTS